MISNYTHSQMLISPARTVVGRVELFDGSTLLQTFSHNDALSSFTVSRAGDSKFFGFGVFNKLELKLVDKDRAIDIKKDNILKVGFGVNNNFVYPLPKFYVDDIARDENTNELTITAYDGLHKLQNYTVADLGLPEAYTIGVVIEEIAFLFDSVPAIINASSTPFNRIYVNGANFDGTETLRAAMDAIAEATQTIYYIDNYHNLCFKGLDISGEPVLEIGKASYFELQSKENRTLAEVVSATELGDNVSALAPGVTGVTQYVRNNPFWELRDDVGALVEEAIAAVGGLSINQFSCKWRGNYLLEPGDKISIITKDNQAITTFLLDDKYTYNGGFSATSSWEQGSNEGETASNPSTLGETLKQTFARVDKANKEIQLVVDEAAAIKLNTDNITASVSKIDEDVAELTNTVNSKMSAEDVTITVEAILSGGVEEVTTTTGFTFNKDGLNISKADSEINTTITENGMAVSKNDNTVLVANNEGVKAEDLHATTFLIIGETSRFEDYSNHSRTGCFWIKN